MSMGNVSSVECYPNDLWITLLRVYLFCIRFSYWMAPHCIDIKIVVPGAGIFTIRWPSDCLTFIKGVLWLVRRLCIEMGPFSLRDTTWPNRGHIPHDMLTVGLDFLWSWWRHQIETFSWLLAVCAENLPVTGEFPSQRPVTRSFGVFFDQRLDKRLSKQSRRWWLETRPSSLWRHLNGYIKSSRRIGWTHSFRFLSGMSCFYRLLFHITNVMISREILLTEDTPQVMCVLLI